MSSQISTAVTYNSKCARLLLNNLLSFQRGQKPSSSTNSVLLFAFAPSSTTSPGVLSDITSTLTRLYPEHVGCISAPLPYQYLDSSIPSEPYSCSLALALVNGVSFRSTISGRAEVQVGRWHAARRIQRGAEDVNGATRVNIENSQTRIIDISALTESDGKVNWDDVWNRAANPATFSSPSKYGNDINPKRLPDALRDLDPSSVGNILYFSDKAPEGIATVLEGAFPGANKLSLIASSTPFITGRPVTLFHNGTILSNGAVGVAFSSSSPPLLPVVELSFPPLVALSTNMNVTSSKGNLIVSLDFENPTLLLLSAIQKHGLSSSHTTWVGKEDEFYVGVIDPSNQKISQLHRINAGDPSRGAIALDAVSAPKEGSIVRIYHLSGGPASDAQIHIPNSGIKNISLFVAPEMTPPAPSFKDEIANAPTADRDDSSVSNSFLAASENGFTLSHSLQGLWKCVVPGGRTGLSWSQSTL